MRRAAQEPATDSASRGRARGPRNMAGKKLFHNSKSWSLMELYNKVLKWALLAGATSFYGACVVTSWAQAETANDMAVFQSACFAAFKVIRV